MSYYTLLGHPALPKLRAAVTPSRQQPYLISHRQTFSLGFKVFIIFNGSNIYHFFILVWKNICYPTILVPVDFYFIYKKFNSNTNSNGSQWEPKRFGSSQSSASQEKETHAGLECMRVIQL